MVVSSSLPDLVQLQLSQTADNTKQDEDIDNMDNLLSNSP